MKRTKKMVQLMLVCGGLWCSTNVYATEGVLPIGPLKPTEEKTVATQTAPKTEETVKTNQTTQDAITFEEEEYVRITQPIEIGNLEKFDPEEDVIKTFDDEINVMGEARMDTAVQIVTYTQNKNLPVAKPEDSPNYTEYKLKTVGATQTFNQLIKLYEGDNHIIIYYTYAAHDIEGSIKFVITREAETVKKQIQEYIVTDPKVVLDQIPQ